MGPTDYRQNLLLKEKNCLYKHKGQKIFLNPVFISTLSYKSSSKLLLNLKNNSSRCIVTKHTFLGLKYI